MRRHVGSLVLVGALVLAGAGLGTSVAGAAVTWVPVAEVTNGATNASYPTVAADDAGNVTAVWQMYDGTKTLIYTSRRPAGGGWSAPVALSAPGQDASDAFVAVNGQGRGVAAWYRDDGSNPRVQAATMSPDGTWSPPVTLSQAGQSAIGARVAIDPSGRATVVWVRSDGTYARAQAASHSAASGWSEPVTLSTSGANASAPTVVTDAAGTTSAAWSKLEGAANRIQISTRTATTGWTIPVTVSEDGQPAYAPRLAAAPDETLTAVWRRSDGGLLRVQSSTRPPGGTWSIPVTLSAPGSTTLDPVVVVDAASWATVVWSAQSGGSQVVQASSRAPDGAWGQPQTLSNPADPAGSARVVVTPGGTATAVWTGGPPGTAVVQAARRPRGGSWTAPSQVSRPGVSYSPQSAVDGAGNVVVAWFTAPTTGFAIQAAGLDATGPVLTGFTAPGTASAGQAVRLSLTAYDVWSAVAGTTWSFGDGTSASGAAVAHTWNAPGTYTVTATVTDAVGNTTTRSHTTTVAAAQVVAPTLGKLRLKPGTIHLAGPRKKQRTKLTVSVSSPSKLTLTFTKKGVKKPLRLTKNLEAGKNTFTLTAKLSKKKRLTVGKWKIAAVAQNAAGASQAKKLTLKVVR